jgi:hypothetical protein
MSFAPAMLHNVSHAPFVLRQSAIASSSRQILRTRSTLPSSSHWSLQRNRNNHTATQYAGEQPAFPGIPTQIYVESVEQPVSIKGKEKEVTPVPEVPKRKSALKAKKNAIMMVCPSLHTLGPSQLMYNRPLRQSSTYSA